MFKRNKNNFSGANNLYDIWYFTTTTHATIGYGDIVPNTTVMKMIVSFHHILLISIAVQLIVIGVS